MLLVMGCIFMHQRIEAHTLRNENTGTFLCSNKDEEELISTEETGVVSVDEVETPEEFFERLITLSDHSRTGQAHKTLKEIGHAALGASLVTLLSIAFDFPSKLSTRRGALDAVDPRRSFTLWSAELAKFFMFLALPSIASLGCYKLIKWHSDKAYTPYSDLLVDFLHHWEDYRFKVPADYLETFETLYRRFLKNYHQLPFDETEAALFVAALRYSLLCKKQERGAASEFVKSPLRTAVSASHK
jgi:hypothetical protein